MVTLVQNQCKSVIFAMFDYTMKFEVLDYSYLQDFSRCVLYIPNPL